MSSNFRNTLLRTRIAREDAPFDFPTLTTPLHPLLMQVERGSHPVNKPENFLI
jgi:hypothetical protein